MIMISRLYSFICRTSAIHIRIAKHVLMLKLIKHVNPLNLWKKMIKVHGLAQIDTDYLSAKTH